MMDGKPCLDPGWGGGEYIVKILTMYNRSNDQHNVWKKIFGKLMQQFKKCSCFYN